MKKKQKKIRKKINIINKKQKHNKNKVTTLPKLKRKNIKFNANIFFNQWIWISLAAAFLASTILSATLFTLRNQGAISLNYLWIVLITICPFIIFITYWGIIIIAFRLIFKTMTKDIEKDAVFPITHSFLIKETEMTVKKYMAKGNLTKIKKYKSVTTKIFIYMLIILILFIIFNFIFVGLTQLDIIDVSSIWLYLFGLLSNIVSLILSGIFGFMVTNVVNAPAKYEERYKPIRTKLYQFKVFLNTNELKKIKSESLAYQAIPFLPLYFYQALLIMQIKEHQYQEELVNWKNFLNLSSYLNQFSWLLFLNYIINKQDQLKLIKKTKYLTKIADQVKKVHTILFYTENSYLHFNENYNIKNLELEYNKLMNLLLRYQNRWGLKMMIASLEKNGLKISQTINQKKDDNIIDERDFDINLFQLNYLDYLFSIIFTNEAEAKTKKYFKY